MSAYVKDAGLAAARPLVGNEVLMPTNPMRLIESCSCGFRHPTVTVVIPTLNEAVNLPHVLARLPACITEVIVVDGRSTDDTVEVALSVRPDTRVIGQTRIGKGNALTCGFAAAKCEIVVALDADGSTDPAEIPNFVESLVNGADFVKGSRFCAGGRSEDITPVRRAGNSMLNHIVNRLFGTSFTDLCYGYTAMWADCLPTLDLVDVAGTGRRVRHWGDGFEIETIMNVRAAVVGLRIVEVSSAERLRLHGESNLHAVRDGLRIIRAIIRERHYPTRASARISIHQGHGREQMVNTRPATTALFRPDNGPVSAA